MVIGGCTGTIRRPEALLLGRYDEAGRLRYLALTHPLTGPQRHDLTGPLTPTASEGDDAGHPWPCPLPSAAIGISHAMTTARWRGGASSRLTTVKPGRGDQG